MSTISVITPWKNGADTLLPDYANAIPADIQIVTVDNGSDPDHATALETFTTERGGIYIRNEQNEGFAAANNQGYQAATGDIIIFLNSDIGGDPVWLQSVAHDVRDGALYGVSLQQQHIYGDTWPYLEGWCIAATRTTWDVMTNTTHSIGPWDDILYHAAYWEDNALCLSALQSNIRLIQCTWAVAHKGGQTAGPLSNHAESFEANRMAFLAQLAPIAARRRNAKRTPMYERYVQFANTQSDIQHHLPLLFAYASGNVVELGTRSGVSTAALLAGVERHGGQVWSVDVDPNSAQVAAGHPQWLFLNGSSTDMATIRQLKKALPIDLLLIDTIHTDDQVYAELTLWGHLVKPGGHICIHDTETFPGVRTATERYCTERDLHVTFVRPCNGMAVIEVQE